jgi:mono/diheme cytochrome c family protein
MKRSTLAAAAIAGFVLVLILGALVFISTGAYNVAATTPHNALTRWLMNTAQQRSVAVRADEVSAQPPIDSSMVRRGAEEYREMCVACHGAPGVERGTLGKGINPKPPDLAKESAEWSDRELFWITKHGIKMAGMPAFGVTHSDEELWGIVAFLRRLESMSPDEYQRLATETETRAHAGTVEMAPQQEMDHVHATGPRRSPAASAPSHARRAPMQHGAVPSLRRPPEHHGTQPTDADSDATEKLKTLAAELLRDSVVVARVRADSVLGRRLENETVRSQLTKPPR